MRWTVGLRFEKTGLTTGQLLKQGDHPVINQLLSSALPFFPVNLFLFCALSLNKIPHLQKKTTGRVNNHNFDEVSHDYLNMTHDYLNMTFS